VCDTRLIFTHIFIAVFSERHPICEHYYYRFYYSVMRKMKSVRLYKT